MAFAEVVEVGAVDARAVKKHVVVAVAAAGRNEAETLVSDSFDCALFHSSNPILFKKSCVRRVRVKRSCKPSVTVVDICTASESDGSASSVVFVSVPLIILGNRILNRLLGHGLSFFVGQILR